MSSSARSTTSASPPPPYFEGIRARASERWDQLEADPELAGPWHQLFKQVQSPRHIVSELLQNADDAGASEANVSIEDGRFVFEHNGEDFIEAHFASICRFGYSNKRALHTIGFRGIGFKSTFSLGDRVELLTPTLAIEFDRSRFTQPHWMPGKSLTSGTTRVEVAISSDLRRQEVEKNLAEWLKSPVSLLFFRNIRKLRIGDQSVHWQSLGAGPVEQSEWMALDEKAEDPFLLVRSREEAFPAEALEEIRQERMLGVEDSGEFPPCRVEIVLGAKGRLYVVLPTGVETKLPFACNAPFIQDPARLKIKDPAISPTNRWLLERAGQLAAQAMERWIGDTSVSLQDRAVAYSLLPDVDRTASDLEGMCAAITELAFDAAIKDKPILLTDEGKLVSGKAAIIMPPAVFEVWPAEQAMALLDEAGRPAFLRHVSSANRTKLKNWGFVEEFSKEELLGRLSKVHLPRPATWRHLLNLWAYIAPEVTGYDCSDPSALRIVPVQGQEVLYSAAEVVRLGEKKLLQSDDDWSFLSEHLIVLNQNWTRFLADQRREKAGAKDQRKDPAQAALDVLEEIGLNDTGDVNSVIERVAAAYFSTDSIQLADCVRLAQIAAKLNASPGSAFRYATADLKLHGINHTIMFDEDGTLDAFLPKASQETQLLHQDYSSSFTSCSRDDWLRWVGSGRSGLQTFAPLVSKRTPIYGRARIATEAKTRGQQGSLSFPYLTSNFEIEDWDYASDYWRHWEAEALSDPSFWTKIAVRIFAQRETYWSRATGARIVQIATTGSRRTVSWETLAAGWILKLREKPCLPDTRNTPHVPADLLRRAPETESFIDVEPFVQGILDREATRPLLDLLGVRKTPSGPEQLLKRLRALAGVQRAPVLEVEKWYRRLDGVLDGCSTADAQSVRDAFQSEKLILAHDGSWVSANTVFLHADEEDVPGAAIIRASVGDLSLWRRVGVADRPSADIAIEWLNSLESGSTLAADEARRVRALIVKYPIRIWLECGHWMNLLGEWVPVGTLEYALSLPGLIKWSHLHDWVKRKTADCQRLAADVMQTPPFAALPALSHFVEERFNQPSLLGGLQEPRAWLMAFGRQLGRIQFADAGETERVRDIATVIEGTTWAATPKLEVIPYVDGIPAGTPRLTDILWYEGTLFATPLSKAKLAKRVPEEIGKSLSSDIQAALAYAFERSPEDIQAYLEENFSLGPERDEAPSPGAQDHDYADQHGKVGGAEELAQRPAAEFSEAGEIQTVEVLLGDADDEPVTAPEHPARPSEPEILTPDTSVKPRPAPKPSRPSVIARFAHAKGYKADGNDRFFHSDGSWIGRANGSRFPWECRSSSGEVLCHYLPKEHCLELEPLQIEADVWGLLEQRPAEYSFILTNPDGDTVEMTGTRLCEMRESGEITIHPATYRLVYDLDT